MDIDRYIAELSEMIDEIEENHLYTTIAKGNLIKARRCLQKYNGRYENEKEH